MKNKAVHFKLRTDAEILSKLRCIAAEELRSINKEVELLIKKHIRDYENTYGEITDDDIGRMLIAKE